MVFQKKWQRELKQRQAILKQLAQAQNQEERVEAIKKEIQMIEEVLA